MKKTMFLSSLQLLMALHTAVCRICLPLSCSISLTCGGTNLQVDRTSPIFLRRCWIRTIRQGCPLSPDIFNLTLEVVLRKIQRTGEGYILGDRRHTTLAYADDLAVIADSPDGMMRLLATAEREAWVLGLSFNAAKCAILHLGRLEDENAPRPVFSLQGTLSQR